MTPWEIIKFQKFLREQRDFILEKVHGQLSNQIVSLTFEILQAKLESEMYVASKEHLEAVAK